MNRGDEPAAPCVQNVMRGGYLQETRTSGLTIREHFAGLAMQGALSGETCPARDVPRVAVELADALIAELAKPRTE